MRDEISGLVRLQELDTEIFRMKKEMQRRPEAVRQSELAVEAAERELEAFRLQVRDLQKIVDQRNVDLRAAEDTIKKLDGQSMSLKTNDEYTAMRKQIAQKKLEIAELDTKILEGMEVVENAKRTLPEREGAVKAKRSALDEAKKKFERDLADMKARLVTSEAEWKSRSASVAPELLGRYLFVRDRWSGSGLSDVSPEGICQGCHMKVTAHAQTQAMAGSIVQCTSCQRFLRMK